jgi:hypothetical protein
VKSADQRRAQKRAVRGRRKKTKQPTPQGKVKVINERKAIVVPREGEKGMSRFLGTWKHGN